MNNLVLSIFPGIDLFGSAFEETGYTVVRGPDLLWSGDVRTFHPPADVWGGIIGGPPCKGESNLAALNGTRGATMVDEFWRIVQEAAPTWWVMEAVIRHDAPYVMALSPRWLGEKQSRRRYFHSNLDLERFIDVTLFEDPEWKHAVLAVHGGREGEVRRGMATYSWKERCELQGVPADFLADAPFTRRGKNEVLGNGVPMAMGRAVAKAVRKAAGPQDRR
ncbi:hypothetical protein LCGC14_0878440 [marine sediment metagenome]|uniref:DNA (cytosine-5-)-methyltransferase n=1 Tax=marine sediment metagenome TaxID=412755 RepID=A0A0F9P7K6_9ZZZZ